MYNVHGHRRASAPAYTCSGTVNQFLSENIYGAHTLTTRTTALDDMHENPTPVIVLPLLSQRFTDEGTRSNIDTMISSTFLVNWMPASAEKLCQNNALIGSVSLSTTKVIPSG